jgi:hypothetical protein
MIVLIKHSLTEFIDMLHFMQFFLCCLPNLNFVNVPNDIHGFDNLAEFVQRFVQRMFLGVGVTTGLRPSVTFPGFDNRWNLCDRTEVEESFFDIAVFFQSLLHTLEKASDQDAFHTAFERLISLCAFQSG